MVKMNNDEVRRRVREHVALALEEEVGGRGEAIMKEIWEALDGDAQNEIADDELRAIIWWLRSHREAATGD